MPTRYASTHYVHERAQRRFNAGLGRRTFRANACCAAQGLRPKECSDRQASAGDEMAAAYLSTETPPLTALSWDHPDPSA